MPAALALALVGADGAIVGTACETVAAAVLAR